MIQSKVDSRFLGTIQDTFHGLPPLPGHVKVFFMFLGAALFVLLLAYWLRKFGFNKFIVRLLKNTPFAIEAEDVEEEEQEHRKAPRSQKCARYG